MVAGLTRFFTSLSRAFENEECGPVFVSFNKHPYVFEITINEFMLQFQQRQEACESGYQLQSICSCVSKSYKQKHASAFVSRDYDSSNGKLFPMGGIHI